MLNFEVCILCGGFGSRLQSVLNGEPKVLAKVAGKPVMGYIFDQLLKEGFEEVFLLTGIKSNLIFDFFEKKI